MIDLKTNDGFIFFAFSLCLGLFLGVLYDLFRAIRQNFNRKITSFCADILYFIICAVSLYLFSIGSTFGEIRLFVVVGTLSSLILEQIILSRLLTKFFFVLIAFIKNLFLILLLPFKKIVVWVLEKIKTKIFPKIHRKLLKNNQRLLYNKKRNFGRDREKNEIEEIEKYFS